MYNVTIDLIHETCERKIMVSSTQIMESKLLGKI